MQPSAERSDPGGSGTALPSYLPPQNYQQVAVMTKKIQKQVSNSSSTPDFQLMFAQQQAAAVQSERDYYEPKSNFAKA